MFRLSKVVFASLAFVVFSLVSVAPAMADVVELNTGGFRESVGTTRSQEALAPIANPGDPAPSGGTYISRTTLLVPNSTVTATSFTGGGFTVTPSVGLSVRQVGVSWATWSAPPFSETPTPQVYFTNGATSLTLTLNQVATIGGFELEPNPFETLTFTAQFFNGATLVETVSRAVSGQAGARLFAIDNAAGFNRIVVSGPADFAIARLRFGTGGASGVPEPATMILLGTGLAGIAAKVRKRRKA